MTAAMSPPMPMPTAFWSAAAIAWQAGQVIGYAGSTGDVTAPQLHFEIRRGVRPVDPRSLLPRSLIVASN